MPRTLPAHAVAPPMAYCPRLHGLLALVRLLYGAPGIAGDLTTLRLGHIAAEVGGFGTLLGMASGLQLFPGCFGGRPRSTSGGRRGGV